MKSRRDFFKDMGKGFASAYLVSSVASSDVSAAQREEKEVKKKRIRIGIIGAENSHSYGYGRIFNIQKEFPGVEVLYIWGETDEFAKISSERGQIPNIVKDPMEMMGKIDALIVDHRHAMYHLEPALPFVKEGIPTFIDKPFCYRVSEGKEFLRVAREVGTPVSSYSTSAHNNGVFDMNAQLSYIDNIYHIVITGPCDIYSKWGGVFFYGVHMVQQMIYIFGEDVEEVKVSMHGDKASASVVFSSGNFATLYFISRRRSGFYRWDILYLTNDGFKTLEPRIKNTDRLRPYRDMVEMFKTGKEPRTHESILKCVAILEALERSIETQQWEKVIV